MKSFIELGDFVSNYIFSIGVFMLFLVLSVFFFSNQEKKDIFIDNFSKVSSTSYTALFREFHFM